MRPRKLTDSQAEILVRIYKKLYREGKEMFGAYYFNQFDAARWVRVWAWSVWNYETYENRSYRIWLKRTYAGREAKKLAISVDELEGVTTILRRMTPRAIAQYVKRTAKIRLHGT